MKIGIVLAKPPAYSETFFNSKIKGLLEHGYTVALYVRENASEYTNCKVIKAPKVSKNKMLQLLKSSVVLISLLPRLNRVLRFMAFEKKEGRSFSQILKNTYTNAHLLKANLDWLHFGFATMAINSENVAKCIGAKMAVSCRGYDMDVYPLKHPNCYTLVWQNVDKVHAISNYMLAKASENGLSSNVPNAIIYPAINTALFQKNIKKPINTTQPIKIVTIARLHWIKGLDDTLQALHILKQQDVKFTYEVIGEGPEFEALSFAIHQLNLTDCVCLVGKLTHNETLARLRDADMYVQYSYSEGFCNAVLEAQAMGCLCIVSDGGALPENILHQETGWVVPRQNPVVLAQTISRVLQMDEVDLETLRTKAQKRVLTDFEINNQIQSFIAFYE